jgi:hypothetical protein
MLFEPIAQMKNYARVAFRQRWLNRCAATTLDQFSSLINPLLSSLRSSSGKKKPRSMITDSFDTTFMVFGIFTLKTKPRWTVPTSLVSAPR